MIIVGNKKFNELVENLEVLLDAEEEKLDDACRELVSNGIYPDQAEKVIHLINTGVIPHVCIK